MTTEATPITETTTTPAAAPAAPPAPAATDTTPAPAGKQTGLQKALGLLQGRAQAAASAPAPAADPPPTPATEPEPTDEIERQAAASAKPPEKPADKPAEKPDHLATAKAQQINLRLQREAVEAKQKAQEAAEKLKAYAALEGKDIASLTALQAALDGKDAKALYKLLHQRGLGIEELGKVVLTEDEPPEDPAAAKVRALEERLAAIEAARVAAEKAAEEAQTKAKEAEVYQQNVAYVAELLAKEVEKYPLLSGYKTAPAMIVKRANELFEETGEEPDIAQLMDGFHKAVSGDLDAILASESAFKAFISRPEIKERALKYLGVKQQSASPASTEGADGRGKGAPAAIPQSAVADAGARKARSLKTEDRVGRAMAFLKERPAR